MAMMTRGARLVLSVIPVIALAATACSGATVVGTPGGGGGARTSAAPAGSGAGDVTTAALRIDQIGGLVTPAMLATRLPVVAVYPDGRVIDQGPQIAIYPSPALPNIQLRRISTADVGRLVARAVSAGVTAAKDYGQPAAVDATNIRFTVRTASGIRTTEIPALLEAGGSDLTPPQQAARRAARALYDALTDLPATLGRSAVGDSAPYTPTAVAAFASPCGSTEPTATPIGPPCSEDVRAWPGPALPGTPLGGAALSCVSADGAEAAAVLTAARGAVSTTRWTSGTRQWHIDFRPLLPDESTCADLY